MTKKTKNQADAAKVLQGHLQKIAQCPTREAAQAEAVKVAERLLAAAPRQTPDRILKSAVNAFPDAGSALEAVQLLAAQVDHAQAQADSLAELYKAAQALEDERLKPYIEACKVRQAQITEESAEAERKHRSRLLSQNSDRQLWAKHIQLGFSPAEIAARGISQTGGLDEVAERNAWAAEYEQRRAELRAEQDAISAFAWARNRHFNELALPASVLALVKQGEVPA